MNIDKIELGDKIPNEFPVIIEIASGGVPIKYEIDKDSGAIFLDRFVGTSMFYPCNYGFIPHTLSGDGDPVDVLLITPIPVMAGCVVKCRPIGVLLMEDESGTDEKIVCVPITKATPYYKNINKVDDLPEILVKQIVHFFERYKDLEPDKWVKVLGYQNLEKAQEFIKEGIARAKK